MSSLPTISYPTLLDYSALPTLRKLCADGIVGIEVTDLPIFELVKLDELYTEANRMSGTQSTLTKADLFSLETPTPSLVLFTSAVYSLSAQLFKLLSHVLELPWERYLEELHELSAPSGDTLRIVEAEAEAEKSEEAAWSTVTFTFSKAKPSACWVRFGEALELFSQGGVKAASAEIEYPAKAVGGGEMTNGNTEAHSRHLLLLYDLRPSKGAVYTRLAGAKMDPLSAQEMENRPRVLDSKPWVESSVA